MVASLGKVLEVCFKGLFALACIRFHYETDWRSIRLSEIKGRISNALTIFKCHRGISVRWSPLHFLLERVQKSENRWIRKFQVETKLLGSAIIEQILPTNGKTFHHPLASPPTSHGIQPAIEFVKRECEAKDCVEFHLTVSDLGVLVLERDEGVHHA